jgi:hypothetical protein
VCLLGTLKSGLLVAGLAPSVTATATVWPLSSTGPVRPDPVDRCLPGARTDPETALVTDLFVGVVELTGD